MENKERVCKKCGKKLPEGYKYKQCEACRNVTIEKLRNSGKMVVKGGQLALTVAAPIVVSAVSKGKIKLK